MKDETLIIDERKNGLIIDERRNPTEPNMLRMMLVSGRFGTKHAEKSWRGE
jgi:hypothetical protein